MVAVSGGMDSMFLLKMLSQIMKSWNIKLLIGHINHNIRKKAHFDEKFVKTQGEKVGIPVAVKRLDSSNRKSGDSIEAWARENRYARLEVIRQENSFDKIATGHHANDQLETILQRLSEKAGVGGLHGIHVQYKKIIRPILNFTKNDIIQETKRRKIKFVHDETNDNLEHPRNFFRHKVIPNWESRYPNLAKSFQSVSDSGASSQAVIEYFLDKLIEDIVVSTKNISINKIENRITRNKFDILPNTIKMLLFKRILKELPWRRKLWNEIDRIINSAKIGKIYKFDNFNILKDREEWIVRRDFDISFSKFKVKIDESININGIKFSIYEVEKISFLKDPNVEYIDVDKIRGKKLELRLWQTGDKFLPFGMKGQKKVSDYLTDKKMNQFDKQKQFVLTADKEIIWLCGHRISEAVKIDPNSKRYLKLSIKTNVE